MVSMVSMVTKVTMVTMVTMVTLVAMVTLLPVTRASALLGIEWVGNAPCYIDIDLLQLLLVCILFWVLYSLEGGDIDSVGVPTFK